MGDNMNKVLQLVQCIYSFKSFKHPRLIIGLLHDLQIWINHLTMCLDVISKHNFMLGKIIHRIFIPINESKVSGIFEFYHVIKNDFNLKIL